MVWKMYLGVHINLPKLYIIYAHPNGALGILGGPSPEGYVFLGQKV